MSPGSTRGRPVRVGPTWKCSRAWSTAAPNNQAADELTNELFIPHAAGGVHAAIELVAKVSVNLAADELTSELFHRVARTHAWSPSSRRPSGKCSRARSTTVSE